MTARQERQEAEKQQREENDDTPFPGWDELRAEANEGSPRTLLLVSDSDGDPVRWIQGLSSKGLHRTSWDLRRPAVNPINLSKPAFTPPWAGEAKGPLVPPGEYTVQLFIEHDGTLTPQGEARTFQVKPVANTAEGTDFTAINVFQVQTSELMRQISSSGSQLSECYEKMPYIDAALKQTPGASQSHFSTYSSLKKELADLSMRLWGDPARQSLDESTSPSISGRMWYASGQWGTRQNPTATQKESFEIASSEYASFKGERERERERERDYNNI